MGKGTLTLFPELAAAEDASRTTGILPSQQISEFVAAGRIRSASPIPDDQLQPASIDLRLGPVAYRVRASFLPGTSYSVERKIRELTIAEMDIGQPTVFEKGCVYVVPLMEELALPASVSAKANPKSTTGRLDIFTRLITDHCVEFEWVREGYKGKLYAEIVSRTFTVVLQAGMQLNQIRFVRGSPMLCDKSLAELDEKETLVYEDESNAVRANISRGLRVSVNLQSAREADVVAYKAKKNAPPIYLNRIGEYDPAEFWDVVPAPRSKALILDPGDFYLLASKEKVRVPPMFAAEMVPYDPSIGEFRVHYAGFFDPGFGYGLSDIRGTTAVLEVRAHEVPILLEHGQLVGRLIYSPMAELPNKVYGVAIGSSYQQQGLALSKQFKKS
jgi:dCTP deaminase